MDCGIPFCQTGCPVNNIIPDWNDLVYRGNWREALEVLHSTNNFPEFTGRVCPAPCEAACVLNINDDPVAIKSIEQAIVDKGWSEGWIGPLVAAREDRQEGRRRRLRARRAGLRAAARARRATTSRSSRRAIASAGCCATAFPTSRWRSTYIDRRMEQMARRGRHVPRPTRTSASNLPAKKLLADFDAVVLTGGSEKPRDLPVPGRELNGIHFAMEFLPLQNKKVAGDKVAEPDPRHRQARGRDRRRRHRQRLHRHLDSPGREVGHELRAAAAAARAGGQAAHLALLADEAAHLLLARGRRRARFRGGHQVASTGKDGKVESLTACHVEWVKDAKGGMAMKEVARLASSRSRRDLVLLAMGYVHPVHEGLLAELGVAGDARGNVKADHRRRGLLRAPRSPKVFAAGDMRRGQSLVVWAIREGRQCAREVDAFLMGIRTCRARGRPPCSRPSRSPRSLAYAGFAAGPVVAAGAAAVLPAARRSRAAVAPPGWSLEEVRFTARDGTKLAGVLVKPAGEGRPPAAVIYLRRQRRGGHRAAPRGRLATGRARCCW